MSVSCLRSLALKLANVVCKWNLLCICFTQISFYSDHQRESSSLQDSVRPDVMYWLFTSSIVHSSLIIQLITKLAISELKLIITITKCCHWSLPYVSTIQIQPFLHPEHQLHFPPHPCRGPQ